MRRAEPPPSRLATLCLLLGCATVLGAAFFAGVVAGRYWPGFVPALGPGVARDAGAGAPRAAAGAAREPARSRREPAPVLTFYQELTAPLAAPPPRALAERAGASAPERPAAPAASPAARATPPPGREPAAAPPGGATEPGPGRFTVQVGAFAQRAPAEALRATLAAAGHPAYVSEVDGAGVRYRVRVGAFARREEAEQAARRLAAERGLAPYVTPR